VSLNMFVADGGAPVPPVPHKVSLNTFVADGGATTFGAV